jgi:hypothetical protein
MEELENDMELLELAVLELGLEVDDYDEVIFFSELLEKHNPENCLGLVISGANPWYIQSVFIEDFDLTN